MHATPRRAVLELIVLVAVVDAAFVATYFLAGIKTAPDAGKLAFTVIWTVITLVVVIRGLARFRRARLERPGSSRN